MANVELWVKVPIWLPLLARLSKRMAMRIGYFQWRTSPSGKWHRERLNA
jgi:hypothetical protein